MQCLNDKSIIRVWLLVIGLVFGVMSVKAQDGQANAEGNVTISGRQLLADKLIVFARMELADSNRRRGDEGEGEGEDNGNSNGEEHIIRARFALDLALELVDDDPELWQMRGDLAQTENDDLTLIKSLGRYCKLVPGDDAAQLRLITAMVNQKQTVEERLKALSPFLDDRLAGSFTGALRSRLASYAGELAHDAGEQSAFKQYLKQAIELDSTNVQAFLMAIDYAKATNRGPSQIGAWLIAAVEADPTNYDLRLELGELLLSLGDYANASDQIEFALDMATIRPDSNVIYELILSIAGAGRGEEALALIRQMEQARQSMVAMRAHGEGEDHHEDEPEGYHDIELLPLEIQLLRLGILETLDHGEATEATYQSIKDELELLIESGDRNAHHDLIRLSLVVNKGIPDAQTIEALLEELADDEVSRSVIGGWYALRQNDLPKARELLEPIRQVDPFAGYGLAIANLDEDPQKSKEYLQQVYEGSANKLVGMMAARLSAKRFARVMRVGDAINIGRKIKRWPRSLRRPDLKDRRWTRLNVEIAPEQYSYLEPIYVTIKIRNISPRPLSMGDGGSLSSQLFAIMNTDMPGNRPMLTVVNVGRRLRLDSQEALEMKARIDRGLLGRILSHSPLEKVNLDIKAIYSPVANAYGQYIAGPLGEIDTQRLIERSGVYFSPEVVGQWVDRLSQADELTTFQILARLCAVLPYLNGLSENSDEVEKVSKAINQRFEQATVVEQSWMLWFISNKIEDRKLFDNIHNIASRTDNKMVRIIYLITQASDPMSTVITSAMRDDDLSVVAFAHATMTRLEQQMADAKAAAEAAAEAEAEAEAGK